MIAYVNCSGILLRESLIMQQVYCQTGLITVMVMPVDDNFRISHVARLLLLFIYSVSQDDNFFK